MEESIQNNVLNYKVIGGNDAHQDGQSAPNRKLAGRSTLWFLIRQW
jgi:hypothetical protein